MKYKVGDKTLLGEIDKSDEKSLYSYRVGNKWWLTESDVDAIIIKPKRNIDHIIELWEGGKADTALDFWNSIVCKQGSVVVNMLSPYAEPSKYPILTPDEIEAVKWLADGGYTHIDTQFAIYANGCSSSYYDLGGIPITKCLKRCGQPQGTAIPLKELLDAQEGEK